MLRGVELILVLLASFPEAAAETCKALPWANPHSSASAAGSLLQKPFTELTPISIAGDGDTFALSLNESSGFFEEREEDWRQRKEIHHAWMKKQQKEDQEYQSHNLHIPEADAGRTFWQWHYEPSFHCEFEQRIGNVGDGGKWICDPHKLTKKVSSGGSCLVYSVGSNGQFDFEAGILDDISPNCEIHVFDPAPMGTTTGEKARVLASTRIPNVTYHQVALGVEDGWWVYNTSVRTKSLRTIVKELGHTDKMIDIFKIDCEGCEWETYQDWVAEGIKIQQIQSELHLNEKTKPEKLQKARAFFQQLFETGFVVFNKEPNTFGCKGNCVEYAFLRLDPSF